MNYTILGVPTTFVADTRRWHSDDFEKRSPITRKTFEPKSAVDTYTYQVYRFRRPRCHPLGGYRPYRYSRHYLVAMVFVPSLFFSCFLSCPLLIIISWLFFCVSITAFLTPSRLTGWAPTVSSPCRTCCAFRLLSCHFFVISLFSCVSAVAFLAASRLTGWAPTLSSSYLMTMVC